MAIHKQPPSFTIWFSGETLNEKSPTEPWRVKLRKVSHHMSRFLVCSSALLGKPGSPGATGDLRDCITGVATLLDDSPMESDNRNGQFCEKQTCDFSMSHSSNQKRTKGKLTCERVKACHKSLREPLAAPR